MKKKKYNSSFYSIMTDERAKDNNLTSAKQMVPYILKLFPKAKSVVDVGCGIGTWASTFKECGIQRVLGLDGAWVDKSQMLLNHDEFRVFDLEKESYESFDKFDIAICLEVAEHIDEIYADKLVELLTTLSNVVIFGAAIPNQGGTYHVNEQFPSYWKRKFEKKNFLGIDLLREPFAKNELVSYIYAQNTLVYINSKENEYPEYDKYFNVPYVVDVISPKSRPARGTNTWKYLLYVQSQLNRAYIKKILMGFNIIKHQ